MAKVKVQISVEEGYDNIFGYQSVRDLGVFSKENLKNALGIVSKDLQQMITLNGTLQAIEDQKLLA